MLVEVEMLEMEVAAVVLVVVLAVLEVAVVMPGQEYAVMVVSKVHVEVPKPLALAMQLVEANPMLNVVIKAVILKIAMASDQSRPTHPIIN